MVNVETRLVVKSVKKSPDGKETFFQEVGRLVMRESDKGAVGTLFLHMFPESFVVFTPDRKKEEKKAE